MKIAIIGCGYVGSAAAKFWKQKGHSLTICTRSSEKIAYLSTFADRVVLIKDSATILGDADAVLIAAAPDHSQAYEDAYLNLASTLLPLLVPQTFVLYTSSTSVYGDHEGKWVSEESPLYPITVQAEILYRTETLWASHNKSALLRLGEIYGPAREWREKIARLSGKKVPGTGLSFTNTIHLEDIIAGLDYILENALTGIFNLVEEKHYLRKEWYNLLCKQWNLPDVVWDPFLISLHGGNKCVSNERLKNAGFRFKYKDPIEGVR